MPAKKNLYALIVGIDTYRSDVPVGGCRFGSLGGCANDAANMYSYLKEDSAFALHPVFLTNEAATKAAIVESFSKHLAQAGPDDVALFFYAGHGIQEHADGLLWPGETDGFLECLVCYNEPGQHNLLADKELRYLLHLVSAGTPEAPKAASPHIVTIFDCCHARDNTRNGHVIDEEKDKLEIRQRRVLCKAKQRSWPEFAFPDTVKAKALQTKPLSEVIPEGAHVHLAACEPDEEALEVGGGGVFTTYLLKVLRRTGGQVSYQDLMSQIRQYLRHSFAQRPGLRLAGTDDNGLMQRAFLNKHIDANSLYGQVLFNQKTGWVFDLGALHGVALGQEVLGVSLPDGRRLEADIMRIGIDYTELDFRPEDARLLDKSAVYKGHAAGLMNRQLKLHLNNADGDRHLAAQVMDQVAEQKLNVVLEDDEGAADYTLQIRNCFFYITRPGEDFRPLVRLIDYSTADAMARLLGYLRHISQWAYVRHLSNPSARLSVAAALKLTLYPDADEARPANINADGAIDLHYDPQTRKGKFKLRMTNVSAQKLYLAVMYLDGNFQVYINILSPVVYPLSPNESVWLFNERGGQLPYSIKEDTIIYGAPQNLEFLQLIASTQDFDPSRLAKGKLPAPLLPKDIQQGAHRSGLDLDADIEVMPAEDWATRTLTLRYHRPAGLRPDPQSTAILLSQPETEFIVRGLYP